MNEPTSNRRVFRFSIRAIFAVTLLAAIGIALLQYFVKPYRLQSIYAESGNATYIEADSVGYHWMYRVFGKLASVKRLEVNAFQPSDAPAFAAMSDLQILEIAGGIDDRIAPCFSGMNSLSNVNVTYSLISFASLQNLSNPQLIKSLSLGVNTTDDDLAKLLPRFPNLQMLDLHGTQVTDEGLRSLASCKKLTKLNLVARPITPSGLKHLSQLPVLGQLDLRWCDQLSDNTFAVLSSFPRLHTVKLLNNYLPVVESERIRRSFP